MAAGAGAGGGARAAGRCGAGRAGRHPGLAGAAERRWRRGAGGDPERLADVAGADRAAAGETVADGRDPAGRPARGRAGMDAACGRCGEAQRRRPAPAAAGDGARPAGGAGAAGATAGADAHRGQAARSRAPGAGAADPRHPCAAGEPAGHLAAEVGTGRPGVPASRPRQLPEDRALAGREARRPRALHRAGQARPGRGAEGAGRGGGSRGAAEAHHQHLEEDAEEGGADRRTLRSARGAGAGEGRAGLLRGAGRGARTVDADSQRVRRLHRAAQAQRLPLAAHRRRRPRGQDPRSADPHPRHARAGRTGRGRALALQGRAQRAGRRRTRPQDRVDAQAAGWWPRRAGPRRCRQR